MSLHPPPRSGRDLAWWRHRLALDAQTAVDTLPRVATLAQSMTILPRAVRNARNRRVAFQGGPQRMGVARGAPTGPQQPVWDNPAITSENIHNDPYEAHGATGTRIISGLISGEEYNPDLEGEKGLWAYHRMWMSDGEVAALLQVLMLPLLEATWSIKAGSDDARDVAIAQFVQDNLFGGMQRTWHQTLEFILLSYLRDGFAVLEKVFALGDDGRVRIRKLAPRISRSIYRWYPNDDDELDRIQQRVWKVDADGISGVYIFPVIEASRLVVFTRMMEGNNFVGQSVLRPAYKHWFFKDLFEKVVGVQAERSNGVPWFEAPPGGLTQAADMNAATQVAQSLHAGEKAYVVTPSGWRFEFVVPAHPMDLLPHIKYHSLQMARSVLAQFIDLERGGSYAMSMDISTFFLQALHAIARYVRDQFDRHVIRELVDLNFEVDRYPTMDVSDLDRRDIDKFMMGLARILQSGWLSHTVDTENAVRELMGLPDLPPDATPLGGGAPSVSTDTEGTAAGPATPGGTEPTPDANSAVSPQGVELPVRGQEPTEALYARLSRGSLDDASTAARQAALFEAVDKVLGERPEGVDAARWQRVVLGRAAAMAGSRNGHGP